MSDQAFTNKLNRFAQMQRQRANRIEKAAKRVEDGELDGYTTWQKALDKELEQVLDDEYRGGTE